VNTAFGLIQVLWTSHSKLRLQGMSNPKQKDIKTAVLVRLGSTGSLHTLIALKLNLRWHLRTPHLSFSVREPIDGSKVRDGFVKTVSENE
jgi:hypothetical protein